MFKSLKLNSTMSLIKKKTFQLFTLISVTSLVLALSLVPLIDAADNETKNSDTKRNPPVITSITEGIRITWMQTGIVASSFDIIIDGVDTNTKYRTSSQTQTVDSGTCFIVQARYDDKLLNSDEVCLDPEPKPQPIFDPCPPGKILISVFPYCVNDPEKLNAKTEPETFDRFGIVHLYPTAGRVFESHWDQGGPRAINGQERDSIDSELLVTGRNPQLIIDGNGTATMQGEHKGSVSNPRMYVFDESREKTWENTEITIYMMRGNEIQPLSYAGLNVNSRSEHQDASTDPEKGQSYGGRFTYFGKTEFVKEVIHGKLYQNADTKRYSWNTSNGQMPFNQWIGLKLVTFDLPNGNVKLELYIDLTNGFNGGDWKKVNEFVDDGNWEGKIFEDPATSVWIKNDGLGMAKYQKFSVREIIPPT